MVEKEGQVQDKTDSFPELQRGEVVVCITAKLHKTNKCLTHMYYTDTLRGKHTKHPHDSHQSEGY